MKSNSKRDMIVFGIIIFLAAWAMVYFSNVTGYHAVDNSVENKGPRGLGLYFDVLDELGYSVEKVWYRPSEAPAKTVQILPVGFLYQEDNDESLNEWVENGGTLVLIRPTMNQTDVEMPKIKNQPFSVETIGKGRILIIASTEVNNKAMKKDTNAAYELTNALNLSKTTPVVFNEHEIIPDKISDSLWRVVPLWVKVFIYQLLLVLGAWFWFKGRRIGKPRPLVEETERSELEYVKSVAQFYKQAKCWDLMVSYYFKSLLKLLRSNEKDWLALWEKECPGESRAAMALNERLSSIRAGMGFKEALKTIHMIENLKKIFNSGRLKTWNKYRT